MPTTREVSVVFLQQAIAGAAKAQGLPNPLPRSCPGRCDGLWGSETRTVLEAAFRQGGVSITIVRAQNGDRRVTLGFPSEAAMTSSLNVLSGWARQADPAASPGPASSSSAGSSVTVPAETAPVPSTGAGLRMPDWGWGVLGGAVILGTIFAVRLASRGK